MVVEVSGEAVILDPVDLLIRVARATEGAQEVPSGSNRGAFVERCQRVTGNSPGDAWCASWLAMVGVAALGTAWPLPHTGGCQELADFARAEKILAITPKAGHVFLIWHASLNRYAHAGLILDIAPHTALTISANTTAPNGTGDPREGWCVAVKPWAFKPEDRFVQWTALLLPSS